WQPLPGGGAARHRALHPLSQARCLPLEGPRPAAVATQPSGGCPNLGHSRPRPLCYGLARRGPGPQGCTRVGGCRGSHSLQPTGVRQAQENRRCSMLELGVFHNGASDLPKKITPDGMVVNDGTVADTHASFQRVLIGQVRQGILAEKLGFNYWFMTEHHFQPEGPEFSPNPRLVEQAAMLDVISGGRLEFGIGRGYQPREAEVFGHRLGATIQDQERNRAYFQEVYEIILKAWTEPSFSYRGQFFSIPPSWTKWN